MTEKEIAAMRHKYRIPEGVLLRPLRNGELATNPPRGWVAVHEHQLKCGLSLPLHPWVQSILSALDIAVGQVTPNMWKQMLGTYVIWELSGNGWPTYDEILSLYRLSYSTKRFCSGTVTLSSRGKSIVTKLPTSTVNWRSTVCLAGGWWESEGGELRKNVPGTFKPIGCAIAYICIFCMALDLCSSLIFVFAGDKKCTLSSVEKRRVERVLASWPEDTRHCYAVTCWAALEQVGLARRPGM